VKNETSLSKPKHEEPLVPVMIKELRCLYELDAVNRVMAVQYCATYPSVPVMIKELRESMPDHVARYTDHLSM
jgi:hypothetical protein